MLHNFYPLCFCRDRGIFDSEARTTPQMLCHHPDDSTAKQPLLVSLRKEVIQPHLPIRLPCYDFTPVIGSTFDSSLLAVGSLASGISDSHGVTGGVYKTRERIHRSMLTCDYERFQLHVVELQTTIRTETLFLGFAPPHRLASLCLRHCSTCVAQIIRGMMI